jgi:hypothetical protein
LESERVKRYQTGLLAWLREPEQPKLPVNGAGWKASLSSKRNRRCSNSREIIIHTTSQSIAQRALDLISASLYLFGGDPLVFDAETQLIAYNMNELKSALLRDPDREREISLPGYVSRSSIPIACAIAAKASRNRKWVYGIMKYNFSIDLYSQHRVDLEPFISPHLGVSFFPSDHITFCHAILSAYSVIEEIGLEVRASAKKPSRINGQWNPSVKQDLEDRLQKAKVNLDEPIL